MAKRKRFETDFIINQPNEFVRFIVQDFFDKEGFTYTEYKGEYVWKKGNGWVTAPQFIKVDYLNGQIHIEAWLKTALLPGVYVGEMDLKGGYGILLKKELQKSVDALIALLQQPVNQPAYAPNGAPQQGFNQPGYDGNVPFQQPIPVATHNPTKAATNALVFGLCGIIGFLIPIIGVIASILGISYANKGMKSSAKGKATVGMVLSIIFLVTSIIMWIVNAILIAAN